MVAIRMSAAFLGGPTRVSFNNEKYVEVIKVAKNNLLVTVINCNRFKICLENLTSSSLDAT